MRLGVVNPIIVVVSCIKVVQAQGPWHALQVLEALHDGAGTTVGESHLPSRNTCAIHGSKVECCSVLGDEEAFRVSHKGILQLDDGVRGEVFDERDTDVLRTSLEAHDDFNVF